MDLTVYQIGTQPTAAQPTAPKSAAANTDAPEAREKLPKSQAEQDRIALKEKERIKASHEALMDLKDIQNFLYLIIGSDLRVESENKVVGRTVNTVA